MSQATEKLASQIASGRRQQRSKAKRAGLLARDPRVESGEQALRTRREWIAQSAYFRAERRGFQPGFELEDWCAAEREIDRLLSSGHIR